MEDDKKYMRFLAACFALNGYLSKMACDPTASGEICKKNETNVDALAKASCLFADRLIEELENEEDNDGGIASVVPKRTRKRNNS